MSICLQEIINFEPPYNRISMMDHLQLKLDNQLPEDLDHPVAPGNCSLQLLQVTAHLLRMNAHLL